MTHRTVLRRVLDVLILGIFALSVMPGSGAIASPATPQPPEPAIEPAATQYLSYMPVVMDNYPWLSPFGLESNKQWRGDGVMYARAKELGANWIRIGRRISWRVLQPEENGPINWESLKVLERELRALKKGGMTPVLVVKDSPKWATINNVRNDGQPTSCGPIRTDKFDDFAEFLRQMVQYFSKSEFDVHHWELGNEPDVDPNLVPPNYAFGCWGDIDDRYYGGRHYGEMLKIVTPVIKAQDPFAKVWVGGLLLDSPNTTEPNKGKPELFLKGILEAGAGDYFDVLPYHWYPAYLNTVKDHDLYVGPWVDTGGGTLGKARFLRDIMGQYGVNKPLVLNETSLMCPPTVGGVPTDYCNPPARRFYQVQASHLVRAFVRGLSEGIIGYIWYTLDGPGWRYTGMLDESGNPLPSFYAYRQLNLILKNTRYKEPVVYGEGIEAYAFRSGLQEVHVLWTFENTSLTASVAKSRFVAAYDRDGNVITPTLENSQYLVPVGFSPIYIIRKR